MEKVENANITKLLEFAADKPVFPCNPTTKAPLIDKGFKAASQDPETVANWWQKWPSALCGVPMGGRTGLLCLDVDNYKNDPNTVAWVQDNINLLQSTQVQTTRQGGRHYFFLTNGTKFASRNGATLGGVKLSGLDIKGEGGYAILWALHGLHSSGSAVELPAALEAQLPKKTEPQEKDDPRVKILRAKKFYIRDLGEGRHAVKCPWRDKHTIPGNDTETVYLSPWYRGFKEANFVCQHAHCSDRHIEDLKEVLGEQTSKQASDKAVIERLAKLSPIEYDRCRKAESTELGIQLKTLDDEVDAIRGSDTGQGSTIAFVDPEPYPTEVDGAELLNDLESEIDRFVVTPKGAASAIALFTLHTYCHDAADVSPLLCIRSPEKRCGKTTLLSLLESLVRRPIQAAHTSMAPLFRATEKYRPTLLIDEADTFLQDNTELRGILNSGHTRNGGVLRCEGEDNETRRFSTWAPKAIALIGKLHPTLADRSIIVSMRRKLKTEQTERFRLDRTEDFAELRSQCQRWADDNIGGLREQDPRISTTMNDRAADNWRALLAIADLAGGEWPAKSREIIEFVSKADDSEETAGIMLLEDLRDLFKKKGKSFFSSVDIVEHLAQMEERPWPEFGRTGKPITKRRVANLLRPFDIKPSLTRPPDAPSDADPERGYEPKDFEKVFAIYLSDELEA